MIAQEVSSKSLEERMHIGSRAARTVAEIQARALEAVQVQPSPAVRQSDAGMPAELSAKGRVVRAVA